MGLVWNRYGDCGYRMNSFAISVMVGWSLIPLRYLISAQESIFDQRLIYLFPMENLGKQIGFYGPISTYSIGIHSASWYLYVAHRPSHTSFTRKFPLPNSFVRFVETELNAVGLRRSLRWTWALEVLYWLA